MPPPLPPLLIFKEATPDQHQSAGSSVSHRSTLSLFTRTEEDGAPPRGPSDSEKELQFNFYFKKKANNNEGTATNVQGLVLVRDRLPRIMLMLLCV